MPELAQTKTRLTCMVVARGGGGLLARRRRVPTGSDQSSTDFKRGVQSNLARDVHW